jgi:dTDP-4-dehydrorhamnose reductase
MDKLKVLVLGDGLLGAEIVKQTNWDYISRKKDNLDINNIYQYIPKDNSLNPIHNVIINCIANTDTYSNDKQNHWETNYVFVKKLIDFCNNYNIKLVHISSDYLYAGSISNASENDIPVHCNTWYGYTKLLSDGLVQLESSNYLLCRCTHKPYPFPYEGAWINQIGNFDYVNVIAELIIKMIQKNLFGLYNVGTEIKTMYELASKTKSVVKTFAPSHVPKNQSMDINKMKENLLL